MIPLAEVTASRRASPPADDYAAFLAWVGVRLYDGQAEFVRVAYGGAEPRGGLARRLFGFEGPVPVGARGVVAAVCGARAGKTYLFVSLRLLWGLLVRDVSRVPPGACAAALIIAPREDLRRESFRYVQGVIESKPELRAMLVSTSTDTLRLRRPDGYEVEYKTGVATAGGTAARGQWWTDFALDEACFFRDAGFKVNDQEIFRAGSARVLPGGQTIIVSTPWAESGLLYELWRENYGKPSTALVAHAPTLVLHDSEMTRNIIERERQRDPDNARREFDAQFVTTGTTVFFEGATLDAALTDEPFVLQPGDVVAAGGDFGFRSDSSALMLNALRGDTLHVFAGVEERPQDGKPLKPSVTVASFAKVIRGRCPYLMADQHYREAIAEHLEAFGLYYAEAPSVPSDPYVRARMLLREGRVKIHRPNLAPELLERFLLQLREVHGRPTSGGRISITNPRWAKGGHGDIVSAWVLAAWQVSGEQVGAPGPQAGTRAWEDAAREARRQELAEANERPAWMARGAVSDRGEGAWWRR